MIPDVPGGSLGSADWDPPGSWLDMSRYPNLDPDQAIEPFQLATLRDALHAAYVPDLAPATWSELIEQVSAVVTTPGPASESGLDPAGRTHDSQSGHLELAPGHAVPGQPDPGHSEQAHLALGHPAQTAASDWPSPGQGHGPWPGTTSHTEPGLPEDGNHGGGHHFGG
jgi:hypothetical protein